MAYSTQVDILKRMAAADLIALTDEAGSGAVGADAVSEAVDGADAVIDAHLTGRYSVPVYPVPAVVRLISAELAICSLYDRNRASPVPEPVKAKREDMMALLEKLAKGEIWLGAPAAATSSAVLTDRTSEDRLFTAEVLGCY